MQQLIFSLDKGELHVHLNGLVPIETIRSILIDEKVVMTPNIRRKFLI